MIERTGWYSKNIRPLREGLYEVQYETKINSFVFGQQITTAVYKHSIRAWDTHRRVVLWRGLAEDPLTGL